MQITVTTDAVNTLVTTVAQTFDGLSVLIAFAIAVPLAFYVARRIARLFPANSRR